MPAGDIQERERQHQYDDERAADAGRGRAPDCPNPNWIENITDMAFTSATIKLFQDANGNNMFEANELVLTVECTFNPTTSNGDVPEAGRTCTSS